MSYEMKLSPMTDTVRWCYPTKGEIPDTDRDVGIVLKGAISCQGFYKDGKWYLSPHIVVAMVNPIECELRNDSVLLWCDLPGDKQNES